jgi:hypothetical protein
MDRTVISLMLFPSMLALVAGIMLAGTLANLRSLNRGSAS